MTAVTLKAVYMSNAPSVRRAQSFEQTFEATATYSIWNALACIDNRVPSSTRRSYSQSEHGIFKRNVTTTNKIS